jgi:hypothetical protein
MTEHAGEVEQGLLWKQEHLTPSPIPSGQPASDLMNIIWRKNEVYLDSAVSRWRPADAARYALPCSSPLRPTIVGTVAYPHKITRPNSL